MQRLILLLLITAVSSGCATNKLATHKTGNQLQPGHGWVVLSATSPNDQISYRITPTGFATEHFRTPDFDAGQDIRIFSLPAGEYRLTGIYDLELVWELVQPEALHDFTFTVSEGAVSLFGEVTLDGDTLSLRSLPDIDVAELADDTQLMNMDFHLASNDAAEVRNWEISWCHNKGRVQSAFTYTDNQGNEKILARCRAN